MHQQKQNTIMLFCIVVKCLVTICVHLIVIVMYLAYPIFRRSLSNGWFVSGQNFDYNNVLYLLKFQSLVIIITSSSMPYCLLAELLWWSIHSCLGIGVYCNACVLFSIGLGPINSPDHCYVCKMVADIICYDN